MRATIRDVASEAGVSVATVSRVLNRSGPASDATRRRVQEVALRLRYTPNVAARSLVTRETRAFGVLLPALHGEFFSEMMRGIDRAAQRYRYHLLVSISHNHAGEIASALRAMRGRVDGLLLMSPGVDLAEILAELPAALPCVLINGSGRIGDRELDAVSVDNFGGAYAMVDHLASAGRRRVATVAGAAGNLDAEERLRGYRAALVDAGLASAPRLEASGGFTEAGGYRAARLLMELRPRPDAVFAANDSMAIGVLRALREAGVRVPEEIALAGFDDIPIARYTSPPLSSVRVPIRRLGARAVRRLMRALRRPGDQGPEQEILPTSLVIRESSGGRPARASRP